MSAVATLFNKIDQYILNPLIALVFAITFLLFFVSIIQLIVASQSGKETDDARKRMLWGLVGMFVMFGAYGIIHLILNTFGISSPSFISL